MATTDKLNLFGEVVPPTITIAESAKCVEVSTATIRNWIKLVIWNRREKVRLHLTL